LPDTTSDVINTLFWPTVIFLAIRFQPVIESKRLQPAASRR
jgi:hypothetical protein